MILISREPYFSGEHHYYNLNSAFGPNGSVTLYSGRDSVKQNVSQIGGITLIVIPFWYSLVILLLD
jgi:hypothetical protein